MSNPIWDLLVEHDIVQGDEPEKEIAGSPWYVKALLAFSGWLAAIFFLGFIGIAFQVVFNESLLASVIGTLLLVAAFLLLRMPNNEFVEHLGLATSMAGQVLIIFAIFDMSNDHKMAAWLLVTLMEISLVVLMPNFVHSVISVLVAAVAWSMTLVEMHIPYATGAFLLFGFAFCWINEFRFPQLIKKIRAIGYGLVIALIALKGGDGSFGSLISNKEANVAQAWIGDLMIGVVTLYVVWRILQHYGQPLQGRLSIAALLATLLICALSMNVQGITVGVVIICCGFFCANRVLLGLGVVSLLFYISSYYYLLESTLLEKSISLLGVGLVLLMVRWFISKMLPAESEVIHA